MCGRQYFAYEALLKHLHKFIFCTLALLRGVPQFRSWKVCFCSPNWVHSLSNRGLFLWMLSRCSGSSRFLMLSNSGNEEGLPVGAKVVFSLWLCVFVVVLLQVLFKCPRCPASFSELPRLHAHMHRHGPVGPHKCQQCYMSFVRPNNLRLHKQTHVRFKLLPSLHTVCVVVLTVIALVPRLSLAPVRERTRTLRQKVIAVRCFFNTTCTSLINSANKVELFCSENVFW